jgi:hypothetical protein
MLRTGFPQHISAFQAVKNYFTHLLALIRVKAVYFTFLTVTPLARLVNA